NSDDVAFSAKSVVVTIEDDDARGVTVSGGPLSLDEADDTQTAGDSENEASYTVVLDSEPTDDVTVSVASADTAIATVSAASLTFTPDDWDEPQTVTVTAVPDDVHSTGGSRAVAVTHTVAAGSSDYNDVSVADVAVTVVDDDAAPSGVALGVDADTGADGVQDSVAEDGGARTARVTATLKGGAAIDAATEVTVSVGAEGDTAVSVTDYAAVDDFTITIPAGDASAHADFALSPVNDTLDEDRETLTVGGSAGTLTVTGAAIAITDDDAQPTLSVDAPSVDEGDAGATPVLRFTVTLDAASGKAVTVGYAGLAGGTATSGEDFEAFAAGTLAFAAGETSRNIDVTVNGDAVDEDSETLKVRLSAPVNARFAGDVTSLDATGTITDDDARGVTVSGGPLALDEADDPDTDAKENEGSYTVVLDSEPTDDVTVGVASADAAVATVSASSLTFTPDDWNEPQTVKVTAVADAIDNTGDSRSVTVGHTVTGGTSDYGGVVAADIEVTVADDDDAPMTATLSVDVNPVKDGRQNSLSEGFLHTRESVEVFVELDGPSRFATDQTLTLKFGRKGDSAVAGVDYKGAIGDNVKDDVFETTITIPAGEEGGLNGTMWLHPINDALDEPDEYISIEATHPALTVTGARIVLRDDDAAPTVSVADAAAVTEGDDPNVTADMNFTVSLSAESGQDVTVPWTLGGSATGGTDYATLASATLTIPTGSTEGTVTVKVKGDALDEPDETVAVTLGAPTGATVSTAEGAGTGTGVIADDDATAVTLSAPSGDIGEDGGAKVVTVTLGRALEGDETLDVPLDFTGAAAFGADYALAAPGTTPAGVSYSNLASTDLAANPPTIAFSGVAGAARSATVTLAATDDSIDEGASETVAVGLGALGAGSGANLGGGAAGSGTASFAITDDDAAPKGIALSVDVTTLAESAGETQVTVTASASGGTTFSAARTVTVTVGGGAGTATSGEDHAAVESFVIVLGAGEASATGTFDLEPLDDDVDEGSETIQVAGSETGGATVSAASITITDDDTKGVTVAGGPLSLDEADNPDTADEKENEAAYTVVLDSEPTADVTVGVASGDAAVATVSASSLTFTPSNWDEPQTVTVTAVADAVDNTGGSRAVTVTHTVTAG
ncbi:MAG: hypothetical protein F4222_04945, partial [Gammaproteobacteria bacterium]|nr:hypothetical protein [Gammaproteobacteria bacterium]